MNTVAPITVPGSNIPNPVDLSNMARPALVVLYDQLVVAYPLHLPARGSGTSVTNRTSSMRDRLTELRTSLLPTVSAAATAGSTDTASTTTDTAVQRRTTWPLYGAPVQQPFCEVRQNFCYRPKLPPLGLP